MKNILLLALVGSAAVWMAPAQAGRCAGGGHGGGQTGESFSDQKLLKRYATAPVAATEQAAATTVTAGTPCTTVAPAPPGGAPTLTTLDAKGLAAPVCTKQP